MRIAAACEVSPATNLARVKSLQYGPGDRLRAALEALRSGLHNRQKHDLTPNGWEDRVIIRPSDEKKLSSVEWSQHHCLRFEPELAERIERDLDMSP